MAPADEADKKAKGQTFLGQIEGAPEFSQLAVVIDGQNVLAYVCSADDKFNKQHSRWFHGTCSQTGEVAATSTDGCKLTGKREGERLKLSVTSEAATLKATLSLEPPGTEVGLWRGEGKFKDYDYVVGYIIKKGKGPAQNRFTGRLALSRKGRSIQGLTLAKKNCKLKNANQLQINAQGAVDGAEEDIDVDAEQIDAVAAEGEKPPPEPKKKKAAKAVEAAKSKKQA